MPCFLSAPSTTFSSTVRLSASMKCWKTMPTPAAIASAGDPRVTASPLISIVPESGRWTPYRIFMRVDLPAPFSPTTAWMVPRRTVRLMSSLAITPGKRLPMPCRRTATVSLPGAVVVLTTVDLLAGSASCGLLRGKGPWARMVPCPRAPPTAIET